MPFKFVVNFTMNIIHEILLCQYEKKDLHEMSSSPLVVPYLIMHINVQDPTTPQIHQAYHKEYIEVALEMNNDFTHSFSRFALIFLFDLLILFLFYSI